MLILPGTDNNDCDKVLYLAIALKALAFALGIGYMVMNYKLFGK